MVIISPRCFFSLNMRVEIFFLSAELSIGLWGVELEMVPSFLVGAMEENEKITWQRNASFSLGH
ncbi:hypothetical protein ACFLXB_09335 [Chloroflexota bacterium]